MSHLVEIDNLLDLVSDVKDIDRLVYSGPLDGLITLELWCGTEQHSAVLMSLQDWSQVQAILTGSLIIEAKS